jgi:hypothetical protein
MLSVPRVWGTNTFDLNNIDDIETDGIGPGEGAGG